MDFYSFLNEYKAVIGTLSIAFATVLAVSMNLAYSRRADMRQKRERDASFGSAIASELVDNADNLMDLYFQISRSTAKSTKITGYKEFSIFAYQGLLEQIGTLGPSLSFMVVDVYGDIVKLKTRLGTMNAEDILADKDDLLPDIQNTLVKVMTCSIMMYFYADYMSGKNWLKAIKRQRVLWVEYMLESFLEYVDKTDHSADFLGIDDGEEITFLKRFTDPEKRKHIKSLFEAIDHSYTRFNHVETWQAQLILRALSYKLSNTLMIFLDLEPSEYSLSSEKEYKRIISAFKSF